MTDQLRIGVIGTGWGKQHIRAFGAHPRATVTAVCSGEADRAAAVANAFGVPHSYGDYQAMLAEAPVDAVAVATPPDLHRPVVAAAFAAGKHVLCEKPLAGTLGDAAEMLAQARASGLVHGMEQWVRFVAGSLYAKELLDAGAVGRPLSVVDQIQIDVWGYHAGATARPTGGFQANVGASPNKTAWFTRRDRSGGFLLATAQHFYDRLLWLFGPARSVAGRAHTALPEIRLGDGAQLRADAHDAAHAQITFASGLTALAQCTPAAWGTHWTRLEVLGEEGALLVEGGPQSMSVRLARRGERELAELPIPERLHPPRLEGVNGPLYVVVDHFLRAVLDGEPMEPSFEDGYRTQEVMEGLLIADATGVRQELPLAKAEHASADPRN